MARITAPVTAQERAQALAQAQAIPARPRRAVPGCDCSECTGIQDGMSVTAYSHGGGCCGMTHFSSFPYGGPAIICGETPTSVTWANMPSNYFRIKRPQETAGDRLKAMVKYISQEIRRGGCIEIVLTNTQLPAWKDFLEEQGFKIVNTFRNSNTSATLTVLHLVYGQ